MSVNPITGIRFSAAENDGKGGVTVYRHGSVEERQSTKAAASKLAREAGLVEQNNRGLTNVTWWVQPQDQSS